MSTAEPDEKLSKAEVKYGPGMRNSRCGVCKWFLPSRKGPARCRWVKGDINFADWCELFHRDHG